MSESAAEGLAAPVTDVDRSAAVRALSEHRSAGRLDDVTFEARQVAAQKAGTWGELVPLFADLPEPRPAKVTALAAYAAPRGAVPPAPPNRPNVPVGVTGFASRSRERIMALTPFAALILFFTTGYNWLWFLGIPIVAILLYGPGGRPKGR